MVAVVGSRAASPYALEVARKLGADLARRNVTCQRHGARRGFGGARRRLDGGGVTVAVFGCGIDIIYPREHARWPRASRRGALSASFRRHAAAAGIFSAAQPHHQRALARGGDRGGARKRAGR
jgi:hypothetical protein